MVGHALKRAVTASLAPAFPLADRADAHSECLPIQLGPPVWALAPAEPGRGAVSHGRLLPVSTGASQPFPLEGSLQAGDALMGSLELFQLLVVSNGVALCFQEKTVSLNC